MMTFDEWLHEKMDDGYGGFIKNGDMLTEDYDYDVVKAVYDAAYEEGYCAAADEFTQ
jgi:hypothetical protein